MDPCDDVRQPRVTNGTCRRRPTLGLVVAGAGYLEHGRAAAYLCRAFVPGMRTRRFGRIVNISSEAGVAIVPGLAAYCVAKHALCTLTEVIQGDNHDHGIKAWAVCPGFVDTDMGEVVPGANRDAYLQVDDVVDVVRYLLHLGDNVKLGPEVLVRTMRNPMTD